MYLHQQASFSWSQLNFCSFIHSHPIFYGTNCCWCIYALFREKSILYFHHNALFSIGLYFYFPVTVDTQSLYFMAPNQSDSLVFFFIQWILITNRMRIEIWNHPQLKVLLQNECSWWLRRVGDFSGKSLDRENLKIIARDITRYLFYSVNLSFKTD